MVYNRQQIADIEAFILNNVGDTQSIAAAVAVKFGISRQAAHRHVRRLVRRGVLTATGKTRSRRYGLSTHRVVKTYAVRGLEEHEVWNEVAPTALPNISKNVLDICSYGFTEMVNNVIDHSQSEQMRVVISRSPKQIEIVIRDQGVGIFEKIQRESGLETPREAIFELTKGKFTTDPQRHTGEGIFFTSRMFDQFSIMSGKLFMSHRRDGQDWLLEDRAGSPVKGTGVFMKISPESKHTVQEVFEFYASERDDYAFSKTIVGLELAQSALEPLISRSQAKRVLGRLDRFKEVLLDFHSVESIGPAFADEIFRVWRKAHPEVRLIPVNANEHVNKMIDRALTSDDLAQPTTDSRAD